MSFRLATGGLKQAGDFLEEGGQDMKEGAQYLEEAGKLMQDAGYYMGYGGWIMMRTGEDLEKGARYAIENRTPVGMGWFRIANAGHSLATFTELKHWGRTEVFSCGQLISKAGHMITQGGDHLLQAGLLLRVGAMYMHDYVSEDPDVHDNEKDYAYRILALAGNTIMQAGDKIKSGGDKIRQVMKILNAYGPIVVSRGRLHQRGQDIVLKGQPATGNVKIAQGIVRWGGALWQRIHPQRLGVNPPLISQQYQRPQRLPGVPKYDWLDNGLNDANNLDEYEVTGYLGQGTFGKVELAERKDNPNIKVAIKKVNIKWLVRRQDAYMVQREKRAMRALKHHNICNLLSTFNIGNMAYFILEYCDNGELKSHVRREGGFTEEVTRFYSGELIMALKYMASKGWVHRDIKPENILLDFRFHLKLTDFGLAKHVDDVSSCCVDARGERHLHKISTWCGTVCYMAPEIFQSVYFTTQCFSDLWSLGCTIFNMVTNRSPVANPHRHKLDIEFDVMAGNIRKLEVGRDDVTNPDLVDLHDKLRENHALRRIGFQGYQEIIDHPFYAPIKNFLQDDTLILQNPPPFKTPPPSANPYQSRTAPTTAGLQQHVRGQSIAGTRQTPRQHQAARTRNLSEPSPHAEASQGGVTYTRHAGLRMPLIASPREDRKDGVSKSPVTQRLRDVTAYTDTGAGSSMHLDGGNIPRASSMFNLGDPAGGASARPNTETEIIELAGNMARAHRETVRHILDRNQLTSIASDPIVVNLDPRLCEGGQGLDLGEELTDDVFSAKNTDVTNAGVLDYMSTRSPSRPKFYIGGSDSPASLPSPSITPFFRQRGIRRQPRRAGVQDDTSTRSPSRPNFYIGGSDSSASPPSPSITPFFRQRGIRRQQRRRLPSFEDYPPHNAVDVSRHTQGEELRPQPTAARNWDVDRHKTASPPLRPRQDDDDNDEFDPQTITWV